MIKAWENYVNNKQGGLYVKAYNKKLPVRTIVYDDKSDQATAVKFYERLITIDKCDILMGPKSSPITFPVTAVPGEIPRSDGVNNREYAGRSSIGDSNGLCA